MGYFTFNPNVILHVSMIHDHDTKYEENPPTPQKGMHKDGQMDEWTDHRTIGQTIGHRLWRQAINNS